jgi:hypothetical protein
MTESDNVRGTVSAVQTYGTLVLVFLDGEDGRILSIPFDHRPFQQLLESEGCSAGDLVGRQVSYDGETVRFIE